MYIIKSIFFWSFSQLWIKLKENKIFLVQAPNQEMEKDFNTNPFVFNLNITFNIDHTQILAWPERYSENLYGRLQAFL